jgi:hypothetical protein
MGQLGKVIGYGAAFGFQGQLGGNLVEYLLHIGRNRWVVGAATLAENGQAVCGHCLDGMAHNANLVNVWLDLSARCARG